MKRFSRLMLSSICIIGLMTGCSSDNTVNENREENTVKENNEKDIDTPREKDTIDSVENGDIKEEEIREESSYEKSQSEKKEKNEASKTMNLSVYVASDDAMSLKREVRPLEVRDMRVGWAVLNALKEMPLEEGYVAPVSKDIEFNSLIIKDGLATVDYDDNGVAMGSTGESMFVESVILSLTRFPTVERVKFTRNGEENPVTGNMVLDREYTRSDVTYANVIE